MNRIAILVMLTIGLFSCEKELEINLDEADKLIVINSVFSPEEVFRVEVTKSFSPFEKAQIEELNDAQVSLFENGTFVEELTYSTNTNGVIGGFSSTTVPVVGNEYRIEVEDPVLGKATGSSGIPKKVSIVSDEVKWAPWGENNSISARYHFSFEIEDLPEENFYYLTMSFPVYMFNTITNQYDFHAYQYAEINTGDLPEHQPYVKNGLLFKDEYFNEASYAVTGTATTYQFAFGDFDGSGELMRDTSVLRIELHSLSQELYNFYSSHAAVLKNQSDIYAEPSQIYTNIENGLGSFGGENITVVEAEIVY